eukprot:957727-Amphidinium_carterae.2
MMSNTFWVQWRTSVNETQMRTGDRTSPQHFNGSTLQADLIYMLSSLPNSLLWTPSYQARPRA